MARLRARSRPAATGPGGAPLTAVVIGIDSLPGIQTARILARRGLTVIGVTEDPDQAFTRTRSCQRMVQAAKATPALVDTLLALAETLDDKAVLVPCEDSSVLVVSRHRARLAPAFHIALPPPEVVELLIDKVAFTEHALATGLPIPPTAILRSEADAVRAAATLPYPAVLKPPHRTDAWVAHTPAKAIQVDDAAALVAHARAALAHVPVLIAQKWVAGTDTDLYSCNSCYSATGELLVQFTAKKIRQWPPRTGISSLGEAAHVPEVARLSAQLFASLPYRGLAYLEAKRDVNDGQFYIIEPNIGRPTGRSAIAEAGGVELVCTMVCEAAGRPLPPARAQGDQPVKWIYLRHDLQSALYYWTQGELGLRQWARSLRGPKAFAIFDWRDPAPFVLDCLQPLRRALTREGRQSRNYGAPELGPDGGDGP